MKKIFSLLLIVGTLFTGILNAQNIGIVDTELILSKMEEYQEAESELDKIAANWQDEIEKRYSEIDEMYREYQANQVLLTEDLRIEKENGIIQKEKELKEYQKSKFGYEGELFQKRQELVRPIQDLVYDAVQKVAKKKSLDIVLDQSSGASILFADPTYDQSPAVMRELGIKMED